MNLLRVAAVLLVCASTMPWAMADEATTEELKLELPEPYFGGTPLDYFGANLEEPNYKPRPPFHVPPGVVNLAAGKPITSSVPEPEFGELSFLVNGDKSYKDESLLALDRGMQWIQIDLEASCNLYALTLWHFHQGDRVYFDVTVRVSDLNGARGGVDKTCRISADMVSSGWVVDLTPHHGDGERKPRIVPKSSEMEPEATCFACVGGRKNS